MCESDGAVDHSTMTKWFKKFRSGCKKFIDQAMSGRPESVDSEAVFKVIGANPASSTRRVSAELNISRACVLCYFYDLGKKTSLITAVAPKRFQFYISTWTVVFFRIQWVKNSDSKSLSRNYSILPVETYSRRLLRRHRRLHSLPGCYNSL